MIKKDSCLEGKTSVPIGTEVYGFIYSKFKIIKGNLIELVSTRYVYTKLEDVYTTMCHWIITNNEIYLKNLKDAQNTYNKFNSRRI